MATPPFGTVVLPGAGDDGPIQFFDPAGVPVAPPASNPECGDGVRGIVSLADGALCQAGGFPPVPDSVPPNSTAACVFAVDFLSSVECETPALGNLNSHLTRDDNGFFYGKGSGGGDDRIFQYDSTGARTQTWNPAGGTIRTLAVGGTGFLAYYILDSSPTIIRMWDLLSDVSAGAFAAETGMSNDSSPWTLLADSNGNVFAMWRNTSTGACFVRRYDATGAFIEDYPLSGTTGFCVSMARGLTSETFVTLHYPVPAPPTFSEITFSEINIESGATVQSWSPDDGSFDYYGPVAVLGDSKPGGTDEHNNSASDTQEDLAHAKQDPVIFVAAAPPGQDREWYAQTDLPHGSNYYGGWKEDRLLSVSTVRRALAGPSSDYQIGTFQVELADDDYAIRTLLTQPESRFYSRWEIDAFMATPSGMGCFSEAYHLATGLVDTDPEFDTRDTAMTVKLSCRDRLGVSMGWTLTGQTKLPRRAVNLTTLPGVGVGMNGRAAWIPWGSYSNTETVPSGLLPPYPSKIAAYGGGQDGPYYIAGFAPWDQTVPPVTGLVLGTSAGGDCPEEEYAVAVFPAMNDGRMGDPTPYVYGDQTVTVSAPNQIIDVSWAGTADKYYVVLFGYYFGWRIMQFIETTGTSCSFDHSPYIPDPGTGVATDASMDFQPAFNYYKAKAKVGIFSSAYHTVVDPELPDTDSPNAPATFAITFGLPNNGAYRSRPNRLWWTPSVTPDVTMYQVQKTAAGPGYVPLNFEMLPSSIQDGLVYWDEDWEDNDALPAPTAADRPRGRLRAMYTRDVAITTGDVWKEFFVAGVPIKNVDTWYYDPNPDGIDDTVEINQGDGDYFLFPQEGSAWDSFFPTRYRDVQGTDGVLRRFMLGYARGDRADLLASGYSILTVDVQGVEDVGDCTGNVITDLHDQLEHFLNYFVVASGEGYTSGLWGPAPTQGYENLPVVNSASFAAVKAMRENEIAGGIPGVGLTGALGEFTDVATELKRWMVSGDMRLGPNRDWQIECHAINSALSPLFITTDLTDEFDIHKRTFKPIPRLSELQNIFRYRSSRSGVTDTWLNNDQDYVNQTSIDNWNIRKQGEDLDFYYIEDPSVVSHIFGKHTIRRANVPMYVVLEGGLALLDPRFDIGRYFNLTHWRGVGSDGWQDRVMWILGSTFNPETRRVGLECLDVTELIGSDDTLLEGLMDIQLGGSWFNAPEVTASPQTVDAYDYWPMRFPWEDFPDGTTLQARIYGVVPSGVSMVVSIVDDDTDAIVATDPTPFTYVGSTDFALHTFQMPSSTVNVTYRLQATISGGVDLATRFKGVLRPSLP